MVKQLHPVKLAESHAWKTTGMVNKYVAIEQVIQHCLLCCLPYERFSNTVIYEGKALAIQQVITFIPDT